MLYLLLLTTESTPPLNLLFFPSICKYLIHIFKYFRLIGIITILMVIEDIFKVKTDDMSSPKTKVWSLLVLGTKKGVNMTAGSIMKPLPATGSLWISKGVQFLKKVANIKKPMWNGAMNSKNTARLCNLGKKNKPLVWMVYPFRQLKPPFNNPVTIPFSRNKKALLWTPSKVSWG